MRSSALVLAIFITLPQLARADAFDNYINPILTKAPETEGVKEVKQLTPELIIENNRTIPDSTSALVIVQTNDGRFSKLLVQIAKRRMTDEAKTIANILLIDRFVTYKEGTDRTVTATGQNVMLFDGFHFSLDLGQVVPTNLGGDVRFVAKEIKGKEEIFAEPIGKAKLFLVTKPIPEAAPKKTAKFQIGESFEAKYFTGKFKLFDDGRRSGLLELQVADDGEVTGTYFSDKDGAKYNVVGKVGPAKHAIKFYVKYPRTEQVFVGWMFTGTGLAITGSSRIQDQDRDAGWFATRVEEE